MLDLKVSTNKYLNPCLVHPVALAINKKNEPPLFATVFVVYSRYYCFGLHRPSSGIAYTKCQEKPLYATLTDPSLLHFNKNNISKIV
jgi:hypothetical protein